MGELEDLYKEEAEACLISLKKALADLKKDVTDERAIKEFGRVSHTLKGNSLQLGYYSVAYLGKEMQDLADNIAAKKVKLDKQMLDFLSDFTGSIEKALKYATKDKEYKVNTKLFEKLDKLLK